MSNHHENDELHFEQIQHGGVQFEDRDLGARGIIAFLIVLGVSGVVLCLIVWAYFDYHSKQVKAVPGSVGPQAVSRRAGPDALQAFKETYQPAVPLQTDDVSDMKRLLESTSQQLSTYGYVDQNSGVVHIPIEQAMDQVVKQGIPARTAPAGQPPVADWGSGRDTVPGAGGGVRPASKQ
jgi:hypothetical protein